MSQLGPRPTLPHSPKPKIIKHSHIKPVEIPTQRAVLTGVAMCHSQGESNQKLDSTVDNVPATKRVSFQDQKFNTSPPEVEISQGANCTLSTTSSFYNRQIAETFERLSEVFPNEATEANRSQLWNIAETAYHLADEVYSTKEANIWANNFEILEDIVQKDEALFRSSMRDLTVMVKRRKKQLSPFRLNRERIENATRPDNPERHRLIRLAEEGMPLLLRPGFCPNGSGPLPPLRRKYVTVQSAVNRLFLQKQQR